VERKNTASLGLGLFSLALGVSEVLIARRIAALLKAEGRERTIRGAGAQSIRAGIGLLRAPQQGARAWDGAGGGLMYLAALGQVVARRPRNMAAWSAIALVGAATVGELVLARALDAASAGVPADPPAEDSPAEAAPEAENAVAAS
jgi:hypothetical protein